MVNNWFQELESHPDVLNVGEITSFLITPIQNILSNCSPLIYFVLLSVTISFGFPVIRCY